MDHSAAYAARPDLRMAGVSLVELMVALAIGLILTLTMATLMLNTSRTHGELSQASMQMDNGRTATQLLATEIQLAGFYGEYGGALPTPTAMPNPCSNDLASLRQAMAIPVQGYDGATGGIPACVVNAGHIAGTDVLVVRRAATEPTGLSALGATTLYVQGSPQDLLLDTGLQANFPLLDRGSEPFPVRAYRVDIFFIGETDRGLPALMRHDLTGTVTTLVEGVENMQIDYGLDRDDTGAPNATTEGGNDAYVHLPGGVSDWQNVVSARIHLLVRNLDRTLGHADDKTYQLGLGPNQVVQTIGPLGDGFKRHVYQSTARVVNVSGRRE